MTDTEIRSPTTEAPDWKVYSTKELLRAAYSLTHQMDPAAGTRREDELREQRNLVDDEIERRIASAWDEGREVGLRDYDDRMPDATPNPYR